MRIRLIPDSYLPRRDVGRYVGETDVHGRYGDLGPRRGFIPLVSTTLKGSELDVYVRCIYWERVGTIHQWSWGFGERFGQS